jgi:hypothetical protein
LGRVEHERLAGLGVDQDLGNERDRVAAPLRRALTQVGTRSASSSAPVWNVFDVAVCHRGRKVERPKQSAISAFSAGKSKMLLDDLCGKLGPDSHNVMPAFSDEVASLDHLRYQLTGHCARTANQASKVLVAYFQY